MTMDTASTENPLSARELSVGAQHIQHQILRVKTAGACSQGSEAAAAPTPTVPPLPPKPQPAFTPSTCVQDEPSLDQRLVTVVPAQSMTAEHDSSGDTLERFWGSMFAAEVALKSSNIIYDIVSSKKKEVFPTKYFGDLVELLEACIDDKKIVPILRSQRNAKLVETRLKRASPKRRVSLRRRVSVSTLLFPAAQAATSTRAAPLEDARVDKAIATVTANATHRADGQSRSVVTQHDGATALNGVDFLYDKVGGVQIYDKVGTHLVPPRRSIDGRPQPDENGSGRAVQYTQWPVLARAVEVQ